MDAPLIDADGGIGALAGLPWHLPVAQWPAELIQGFPLGISRHSVRFISVGEETLAVKETDEASALREAEVLTLLNELDIPAVTPRGTVTSRRSSAGRKLPGALLTYRLAHSMPYRALFSHHLSEATAKRLISALAALLCRIHLTGVYWGDVSLSNTLFRRDAHSLAAYVVDAETAEFHSEIPDGVREHDLELAMTNIAGELIDLACGGLTAHGLDPVEQAHNLQRIYSRLWQELTRTEAVDDEQWHLDERIRALNDLGFDLGGFVITTDVSGTLTRIEPRIAEPGYYPRRLFEVAQIRAEDNQARAIINDIDGFRSTRHLTEAPVGQVVTHWLAEVYDPVVRALPGPLLETRDVPQAFCEFLDTRHRLAKNSGHDVDIPTALESYLATVRW